MTTARWISGVLLAIAMAAGLGVWLQRESAAALRSELALLRDDQRALQRLRAEHERLLAAQIPDGELARLRADHAALMRLRAEIEQLKGRAAQDAK